MNHLFLKPSSLLVLVATMAFAAQSQAKDLMPSWNDTAAKKTIVRFVEKTTAKDSADFVPAAERQRRTLNSRTCFHESRKMRIRLQTHWHA